MLDTPLATGLGMQWIEPRVLTLTCVGCYRMEWFERVDAGFRS